MKENFNSINLREEAVKSSSKNTIHLKVVTYLAVIVSVFLILIKFIAWIYTDSVSILSGLVDSSLDAIASVINLIAVRQALVPADSDHRFGHGKAEALSGLAQSTFIFGSIVFLIIEVIPRLFSPEIIKNSNIGLAITFISLFITMVLVIYQRYVIRKTNSLAVSADSFHYFSDLILNCGVIVALLLSVHLGLLIADPIIALSIGLFILYGAYKIFRTSIDQLMDKEFPESERKKITEIVLEHKDVLGVHDLRTRRSGSSGFIQLHLDLKANISLIEAHEISESVEKKLINCFPNSEIIIHQDPIS